MISTSVILVVSGGICLSLTGLIVYSLLPRDGRPPSPWTSTDFRATSVAMLLLILLLAGASLLAKGIF
jgi:hypothetical protein